jgi:hypothetical protein
MLRFLTRCSLAVLLILAVASGAWPEFRSPTLQTTRLACVISGATADTVCQVAPGAGLRFYVTDVVISNGATAQTVRIITGTGTTCGTSTDIVIPLINMPINGTVTIALQTPLQTALNEDICSDISGTTAHSVLISGYILP